MPERIRIRVTPKQHEALALDDMHEERGIVEVASHVFDAMPAAWRALCDEAENFASDWAQSDFGSVENGHATALRGLIRKIKTALRKAAEVSA